MNVRHPLGVLHSFSIKNIFYDKTDLRLFYIRVTIYSLLTTEILKQSLNSIFTVERYSHFILAEKTWFFWSFQGLLTRNKKHLENS